MGAQILSVAIAEQQSRLFKPGGMKLADQAALACLEHAERRADEIDLLVNAGVYHDKNLGEPALASLIQRDIGATQSVKDLAHHGTFSFDVVNGAAGVVTAMHLIDGFLGSAITLGMVVASDANPGSAVEPEFPFAATGAAALLGRGDDAEHGFIAFQFDSYPEFEHLFQANIVWHERRTIGGRNVLEIHEQPGFEPRAIDCAAESTRKFLERLGLAVSDIDLLLTSQWPVVFPDALAEQIGLESHRLARVSEDLAGAYTAAPLAALAAAERDGRWAEAKNVLFVTVGAGINCALAFYRNAGAAARPTAVGST